MTNKYSYLNENFKPFSALSEDTFSVTRDGLEDLKDFIDDDITDETIDIIDTEASTEDELQDSYIGKVILDCNVCHSKLYKDIEDIHIDEESNNVNVDEECPYCYSTDGYKIVGKIAEYSDEADVSITDTDTELEECETADESCKYTKESIGSDLAKYQKWVDYDMKRYGKISDKTNNLIKKAGLTVIKDQYGEYEVTDHSPITEDLDEIEIKGND